jgi:hypothetical protein
MSEAEVKSDAVKSDAPLLPVLCHGGRVAFYVDETPLAARADGAAHAMDVEEARGLAGALETLVAWHSSEWRTSVDRSTVYLMARDGSEPWQMLATFTHDDARAFSRSLRDLVGA